MNTFSKIQAALKSFGYPAVPDRYTEKEKRWFTYNYADDYAATFGDDEPDEIINSVQVHLFLPLNENFTGIKKEVRKALMAQGFTCPDITVLVEQDNNLRHIVFECDTEEED